MTTNGLDDLRPDVVPKAKSITHTNIESAYVFESAYQLRRIEAFAQMNSEALAGLGAAVPHVRRRRSKHHHKRNKTLN
jgi:hypothetical protein